MAVQQTYGQKETFLVSTRHLTLLNLEYTQKMYEKGLPHPDEYPSLLPPTRSSHREAVPKWTSGMANGTFNGEIYSPRTIGDYNGYVNRFFDSHSEVSQFNIKEMLAQIPIEQEATRDKSYKAMLCFSKFLCEEGHLPPGELEKIADPKMRPKCKKVPLQKTVNLEQVEAVLRACENDTDRLLIMLLLKTGIRASEACALKREDIFYNKQDLSNSYLRVLKGKGRKDRKVPIPRSLMAVLKRYYNDLPKKHKSSYLLWNNIGKPMDRSGLYQRIRRIGEAVNVDVHPHALRRAFVTINHKKGVPLEYLQKLCGHSNILVTRSYLMDTIEDALERVNLLD